MRVGAAFIQQKFPHINNLYYLYCIPIIYYLIPCVIVFTTCCTLESSDEQAGIVAVKQVDWQ